MTHAKHAMCLDRL